MDIENSTEERYSKYFKTPVLILISAIVIAGICLVLLQFNTDRIPVIYLTHTDNIYTTYFELDDSGNRIQLEPVFDRSGFLEGFTGSEFLDTPNEPASDESTDVQRHRIGFSRILFERLDQAKLTFHMPGDVWYIVFLNDIVLYSDYPDPNRALSAAFNNTTAQAQVTRNFAQEISVNLPSNFTGMTISVFEFITQEQAFVWRPAVLQIEAYESERLFSILTYGQDGVLAGGIGIIVILLTLLLAFQLQSGNKTGWLLILPVIYGILLMVRTAFVEVFAGLQFWPLYEPVDFLNGLTYFCGGNLLLIFLALRLNHRIKYILLAASALHLTIAAWQLIYYYVTYGHTYIGYEYVYNMTWLTISGSACILFAFTLMVRERKENRYFKQCIWIAVAFLTGFSLIILLSFFTNPGLFSILIEPVNAIGYLELYPLNNILYLLILLMVTTFSADECITKIAELRFNMDAMERTNQMKAEFLGNISHELKTPLTSVSVLSKHSYSTMAEDWKQNDETMDEIRDNLRIISVESDRIKRVVDGLLNVAVIEQNELELQKEYFSVPDLVQEIGAVQFKAINTTGNTLKTSFAPDLQRINADRERFKEVLLNLLNNAVRHTKDGTIIVAVKQNKKRILLSVSDNGEGIPTELQGNLFKRFLNADIGRAHGTGLGLYFCKQIIELHGGSISLESKPGTGTTVYIDIPADGAK